MPRRPTLRLTESLSKIIKQLMLEKDITQLDICKNYSIDHAYLSRILSGKKGLGPENASIIYGVLGQDDRLDFLKEYIDPSDHLYSKTDFPQAEVAWINLLKSYIKEIKFIVADENVDRKVKKGIVNSLEKMAMESPEFEFRNPFLEREPVFCVYDGLISSLFNQQNVSDRQEVIRKFQDILDKYSPKKQ